MSTLRVSVLMAALLVAIPALTRAQDMSMGNMPGMLMPTQDAHPSSHADHGQSAPATDAKQTSAHDGESSHAGMDHSMHDMAMPGDGALPPNDHIPPPSPQLVMHDMSASQMTDLMQMDDAAPLGMLLVDRLERSRSTGGDYATSWEAEGWWGNGINRLWLKTEGERDADGTQDGRVEALWSHAWTSFWDWQVGARQDFGQGPNRQWVAVGVQGLAPYWFETQATFYAGEQGRTALRLETSYDLRFTQRLILAPQIELNFYGKDDPQRGISSGLSNVEAGLRLRYEFSRKFAPYVGVNWTRRFGTSTPALGEALWHARETTWVAGVRLWF
ncbi:copper resistance protein B [Dyella sp. 20L07]|uniref:copper resistance protein B n=1 Tax=Dyella sp. 20L07 TaxID=3384240 RepID=UPI003D2C19B3